MLTYSVTVKREEFYAKGDFSSEKFEKMRWNFWEVLLLDCARDVIKFSNPKLESHLRFYAHEARDVLNLYLSKTFQLNNVLRLETGAF